MVTVRELKATVDTYDFTVSHLNSLNEMDELARLRHLKYETSKAKTPLKEIVIFGIYLLTYRGTIQMIDQNHRCGRRNIPYVMSLKNLEDGSYYATIRTKGISKFPRQGDICPICRRLFTIEDVKNGNLSEREESPGRKVLVHAKCNKTSSN